MKIGCSSKVCIAGFIVLLGVVLRSVVVFLSDGSNDIRAWYEFASFVGQSGVCACYRDVEECNHPPLSLLSSDMVRQLSLLTGGAFSIIFKASSLFAELVTMGFLYRFLGDSSTDRMQLLLLACYAISPLPILVTAFHGNTDGVVLAALFLAVYLRVRDRPASGALSFGIALNWKLIPILWLPLFLIQSARRERYCRDFLGCGICLLLATTPIFAAHFECPFFDERVLGYPVAYDRWGFIYLFSEMSSFQPHNTLWSQMESLYRSVGRYVSLVVACLIALYFVLRPSLNFKVAAAAVGCAFLVFTPGWGVQYLVYPLPFLLVAQPLLGALYAVIGGGYATAIYAHFLIPGFPYSTLHNENLRGVIGFGGIVVWVFLGCSLLALLRSSSEPRTSR